MNRKQRRANFFGAPGTEKTNVNTSKRPADHDHSDSPKRKRVKTNSVPVAPTKSPKPSKQSDVKKAPLEKHATSKPLLTPRSQREKEDDAYISYLEGKLGLSGKAKGKKKAIENDGLDGTYPHLLSLPKFI